MSRDDQHPDHGIDHGIGQRLDLGARPEAAAPPRYRELVTPMQPEPLQTNGMGVASFVFSILAFVALPVVGSIVGLVLGIIAMRREPKGLAIAGTVLSVVGLLIACAVLAAFAMMFGFFASLAQGFSTQSSVAVTIGSQQWAATGAAQHLAATGDWPSDIEFLNGGAAVFDAWGTPMVLKVVAEGDGPDAPTRASIESAGPDGVFDTEDDLSWPVAPSAEAADAAPTAPLSTPSNAAPAPAP